jgi:TonB family protein
MRCLTLLFSLCLHGTFAGVIFLFSVNQQAETEQVYHVALAEFIQPDIVQEAPALEVPEPVAETAPPPPSPPAPEPEPEVIPPTPDPTPESPQEPEPKVVSTIKPTPPVRARPAPKPASPPPVAQPSPQPQGEPFSTSIPVASGPRPRQFGGLSAYDQDHVDQRPSISRRVEPEYPTRARRMNIEGSVTVELVVDTAGLPKACTVRSADPAGYFEESALNATQKMRSYREKSTTLLSIRWFCYPSYSGCDEQTPIPGNIFQNSSLSAAPATAVAPFVFENMRTPIRRFYPLTTYTEVAKKNLPKWSKQLIISMYIIIILIKGDTRMKLQCTLEVNAPAEKIWPYYADPAKRSVWEEDLESLIFDGEVKTGTTGRMKLKEMPEMPFTLTEIIANSSYCDRTDVPGMGSLHFDHKILSENGRTYVQHSVRLEKETFTENDLGFLNGVFSDVPGAVLKIKKEVEK